MAHSEELAPVALFAYARPDHLRRTVDALAANELARDTRLIVFSDGNRDASDVSAVKAVRQYLSGVGGFAAVSIVERPRNMGLADSIISGVTEVVNGYGRVIVLEDDVVTSRWFLKYMNDALIRYSNEQKVMHIAGYMFNMNPEDLPEAFFLRPASCWGWATWKRAWRHFARSGARYIHDFADEDIHRFNLNGAHDYWGQLVANERGALKTWAVYWYASVFSRDGLCLHPRESLVTNIGHDGSGTNCGVSSIFRGNMSGKPVTSFPVEIDEHAMAMRRLEEFFGALRQPERKSLLRRMVKHVAGIFSTR